MKKTTDKIKKNNKPNIKKIDSRKTDNTKSKNFGVRIKGFEAFLEKNKIFEFEVNKQ